MRHGSLRSISRSRRLRNPRSRPNASRQIGLPTASLPLNRESHVLMRSQLQPHLLPGPPMIARINRATNMHARPDGPVLFKVCVVTVDAGRVCALLLPDFVSCSVGVDVPVEGGGAVVGGVVGAHCFDYVPFYEGIACPTVEGQISPGVAV